jgi:tripartite-type tricarboxylate transporter receptor subunit TctC
MQMPEGRWLDVMKRFSIVLLLCAAALVNAADFPSKPVRLIVGAAAGSTGDVLARVLGDQVSILWKQPAIVERDLWGALIKRMGFAPR